MARISRRTLLLAASAPWALAGCDTGNPVQARAQRAAESTGDIVVGVTWPFSTAKGTYWDGVELARETVHASGGVLGRKLSLLKRDDKLSVTEGTKIAHEFANNLDMVAVLGTLNSYITLTTAPVYEGAGLVLLTQGSSVERLTQRGYKRIFRQIPSNHAVGERLADHARYRGYKRVLIYYVKNGYGIDLANAFEQRAQGIGLEVADRVSYLAGAADYALVMQHWKDFYSFDAIFVAGSLPDGAAIIQAIRKVGIRQPVFGADGLDSPDLVRLGGAAVEGTEVTAFFHPKEPLPEVRSFIDVFLRRYQRMPDSSAALGYDAVMLLVDAIRRANSTQPDRIAEALRGTRGWRGVTGTHQFDAKGNLVDKPIVMQVVKNGKFEFVTLADPTIPEATAPASAEPKSKPAAKAMARRQANGDR